MPPGFSGVPFRQIAIFEGVTASAERWSFSCCITGMRQESGYSLIEMLIGLAIIGVVLAIAVPVFLESNRRTSLWTGSERLGAVIRQTRLKAISQNQTYRVRFDCPAANQVRSLILTGTPATDDAVNRCAQTLVGDGEIVEMPTGVSFDPEDATELRVTPRGVFTAVGDSIPLTINVSYGTSTRTLAVSATGQITFSGY